MRTLLAVFVCGTAAAADPPSVCLFDSGQEGYPRYRIPALLTTPKGTVLAFCEGRKDGGGLKGNIDLILKRSGDSGKTWGPVELVADDDANTLGNPCPILDPATGTVWLLFTRSLGTDTEEGIVAGTAKESTRVFVTSSTDDGKTWAKPRDITDAVKKPAWTWYGTGPGTGIRLKSGRLLAPCYHADKDTKGYHSHAVFSDDGGKTWHLGGVVKEDTSEPHAAERADGSVVLSARTMPPPGGKLPLAKERRTVAVSTDGGATWGAATLDDALYDPGCEACLYCWPDAVGGNPLWLYAHPAGPGRRNLTLRTSRDEGKTWDAGRLVRTGDAQYSSLAKMPDGAVGCLFESWTDGNYRVYFTRVPLDPAGGR